MTCLETALTERVRELEAQNARLRQQIFELQSRVSSLNGLVIETYYPHSSRQRADESARPPPWASESQAQ